MTKKQELINYFTSTITGFTFLKVGVLILEPGTSVVKVNAKGNVKFKHKNDFMLSYLNDSIDDDLIGFLPDTETKIKINSWTYIDRNIQEYE